MKQIILTSLICLLLALSACSQTGGLASEVEESKIEREEDQSKSIEERQEETLNQLIQDGAYIEEVKYTTPGGVETLEITFQITDDVIEKIEFELEEGSHPISQGKVKDSEIALQNLLIGKNINDVEIPSSIAGSSLTTTAFKKHVQDLSIRY